MLYKFVRYQERPVSENGEIHWDIGKWHTVQELAALYSRELYCSTSILDAFMYSRGEILAEVEIRAWSVNDQPRLQLRVVRAWRWKVKDYAALAIFSAEQVLRKFNKYYPTDSCPRIAIEAAKQVMQHSTIYNRFAALPGAVAVDVSGPAYLAAQAAANAAWAAQSADAAIHTRGAEVDDTVTNAAHAVEYALEADPGLEQCIEE